MIKREYRFHGHNSLWFAYRRGRTIRGPHHSLKFVPRKRGETRVAVVVSRKVSKSAVVRNRIRRRIYEVFRELQHTISAPYDLIFIVHDEALATQDYVKLKAAITAQLEKAGITAANTPKP